MADQPSSSSAPHLVLSDLLSIRNPNCRVAAETACSECDCCQSAVLLHKLKADVSDIISSLEHLNIFGLDLGRHMEPLAHHVNEGNIRPEHVYDLLKVPHFMELNRAVKHFKLQLPWTPYCDVPDGNPRSINGESDHHARADVSEVLISQLRNEYDNLTDTQKKCLCCCSVFDSEIKKRVLINWWIGEGLLQDPTAESDGQVNKFEQAGEGLLELLEQKQFINRVYKKRRATDDWWMEPRVRVFVRSKAKDSKLFDFDSKIMSEEVMLLKSDNQIDDLLNSSKTKKVKTVFNVDRVRIGENEARIMTLMESLRVLHLGRSRIRSKQHIRVNNLNLIMKRLKKMKELRLLSLEGISSITELLDSVCDLKGLLVLNLRACQALESLPSGIGNLNSLVHLDMSGCYMLMSLPKEVSLLVNLEVLKGFVIGEDEPIGTRKGCTLSYLRMIKKLHKLSIYVLSKNFPQREDLKDLANIKGLVKLKIVWKPVTSELNQDNAVVTESSTHDQNGQVPNDANQALNSAAAEISRHWMPTMFTRCCRTTHVEEENNSEIMEKLEKLDLWYAPDEAARMLLSPKNFTTTLKKLYIRYAKIQHLKNNHAAEDKWSVNMLRLLYLPNLEMGWAELKDGRFPKLSYLELHDCPKLQFSQHFADGVWIEQRC